MTRTSRLALLGGEPVRKRPLPSVGDSSGRWLGDEELRELSEVIKSGKLNRVYGEKVAAFEREFARLMGAKHAVASTSGTAAIHVGLGSVGVSPGDEVVTSPITDMGTIIPILFQGAVPVFADISEDTFTIDPDDLGRRITEKTYAIVPVHLFGMPVDMDAVMEVAEERGIFVVEDCAQAHLAEYKGRKVGTIGHMGAFSLQQSKHITCGDGGITITNDDELADRARLFADKGWDRSRGREYVMLGMNYRMTELQGAVALAQTRKLEWIVRRRRRAAERLNERLSDIGFVKPPIPPKHVKHSYWQYPILVDVDRLGTTLGEFANAVRAEGIPCSAGYIGKPIYLARPLREGRTFLRSSFPLENPFRGGAVEYREGLCPVTERVLRKLVVVPWNEFYTDEDVDDIADAFEKVVRYYSGR